MNENLDKTSGEFGFLPLSSSDILSAVGDTSNGHTPDEIPAIRSVSPTCAACKDTRWLASEPPKPGQAPILVPCVCQQRENEKTNHLATYANLGGLSDKTFKTFRPRRRRGSANPDSLECAVEISKNFAKDPIGWLVISGPLRTGKSHIAAAITNQCTTRGIPTKFVSAMDIAELVRDLDSWSDSEDAQSAWVAMINAPVLIIDDLGMQLSSTRVEERLDQLLTVRASAPSPTVIVLARQREELPDRIAQRFSDEQLCTRIEILPRHIADSSVGRVPKGMLERMTFKTFNPNGAPGTKPNDKNSLSVAFAAAKDFARKPEKWLHLHGPTGVGKTHLAVAIAGHAQSNGFTPTYWRVPELLDRLRDSFSDRTRESFDERLGAVKNSELLILDDLCPPTMTDWTLEKLYQLVCHRYDLSLPTVSASQFVFWENETIERHSRLEDHLRRQGADYGDLQDKLLWDMINSRLRDADLVRECVMCSPDYRHPGA